MKQLSRLKIQEVIAGKVKTLRLRKKMNQADLARASGLTQEYIAKIETGRRIPTLKTLCNIGAAVGVTPAEFLEEEKTTVIQDPKKQRLIKMIKESKASQVDLYYTLIAALRAKK